VFTAPAPKCRVAIAKSVSLGIGRLRTVQECRLVREEYKHDLCRCRKLH
jgi:hypothetical protein